MRCIASRSGTSRATHFLMMSQAHELQHDMISGFVAREIRLALRATNRFRNGDPYLTRYSFRVEGTLGIATRNRARPQRHFSFLLASASVSYSAQENG
jgi:hypothetical protein